MVDKICATFNSDLQEQSDMLNDIVNDSQLGPSQKLVVSGPYVNAEPTFDLQFDAEAEAFTQNSNERFYNVSPDELDFIASQATAQSTKSQTKWAVKIFTGKTCCNHYFKQLYTLKRFDIDLNIVGLSTCTAMSKLACLAWFWTVNSKYLSFYVFQNGSGTNK